MRVTTSGRYALRAMLDLALNGQDGPVLRQEITTRQEISSEYIAQLFRPLARAGLVRSVMGPGGGYQLARSPDEIKVGEILTAVEGPFAAVACVLGTGELPAQACPRVGTCAAHVLWSRLTALIAAYLNSVSLAELCGLARQLENRPISRCEDPLEGWLGAFPEGPLDGWMGLLPEGPDCPLEYAI